MKNSLCVLIKRRDGNPGQKSTITNVHGIVFTYIATYLPECINNIRMCTRLIVCGTPDYKIGAVRMTRVHIYILYYIELRSE